MSVELVNIDFHGDTIVATRREDGAVIVGFRHLCRVLNVEYRRQLRKLRTRSWAEITTAVIPTTGGPHKATMISLKTLHGWLFSIDENKVRAEMKPKLMRYQAECVEALTRHFQGGPPPIPYTPWAARFRETLAPHSRAVLSGFPPGSFTVITEGVVPMLMLEDELIRHMMEVRPGDRPCVSIGLTWSNYRKKHLGKGEPMGYVAIRLPDRELEVPVTVYGGDELHLFKTWLNFTYLPEKLLSYLNGKPEFRVHGTLPRASVADNTCRTITGRPATLVPAMRRLLAANNGFVPAARTLSPSARPPQLPPGH